MKSNHGCPVQATSNVISGKWKVLILWRLSFCPHRFSELRNLLAGVSEKVLTAQLRELENDGMVLRTSSDATPPRVDYRLSPAGEELIPIMEMMCAWAQSHLGVEPTLPPRKRTLPAATLLTAPPASIASGQPIESSGREL